jgi:archaellum component FlaG (FlaF/FlaG flagellin family)
MVKAVAGRPSTMGIMTWILLGVIVLVAIGLGLGVFFNGLIRGAEKVGENDVVQNASEETQDFIDDRIDVNADSSSIVVTLGKPQYSRGEQVAFSVKNTGTESLEFPDSALGLQVKNDDTGQDYSGAAALVITELDPGETKVVTWDDDGAPAGDYTATVRTTDGKTARTSFELT